MSGGTVNGAINSDGTFSVGSFTENRDQGKGKVNKHDISDTITSRLSSARSSTKRDSLPSEQTTPDSLHGEGEEDDQEEDDQEVSDWEEDDREEGELEAYQEQKVEKVMKGNWNTSSGVAMQPPSATNIEGWNTDQVIQHLHDKFPKKLSDVALDILRKQEVEGIAFLELTKEELTKHPYNMAGGPAAIIGRYVKELNGQQMGLDVREWRTLTVTTSLEDYRKVIAAVKSARAIPEAALRNPLCWGVLDFHEDISPSPGHPCAKDLLPETEFNRIRQYAMDTIKKESCLSPSAHALLEALPKADIASLSNFGEEMCMRGILGVWSSLHRGDITTDQDPQPVLQAASEFHAQLGQDIQMPFNGDGDDGDRKQLWELLANIDLSDKDTQFIGKCLAVADTWVQTYGGNSKSERTVDMLVVGPFCGAPGVKFSYGETHSDADRQEKSRRSPAARSGKACDFIFWRDEQEVGIGENSGPNHKDNHAKAKTDFVNVIKVARAQHIQLQTTLIEESKSNPLPTSIQDALKLVAIPFFQVIGRMIKFYLLMQLSGDVYGIWDWATERFPAKNTDITEAVSLCKSFLIHRNLLNLAGRLSKQAITEAKTFRNSMQVAPSVNTVKLTPLLTPEKSNSSRSRKQSRALPTSPTPLSRVCTTISTGSGGSIRLREHVYRASSPSLLPRVHKFSKRSADSLNIGTPGWTETPANYEKWLLEEDSSKKRRVHKQREEDDEVAVHIRDREKATNLKSRTWEQDESRRPFDRDHDMDGARRLDIKRKGSGRSSKRS